MRIFLIFSFLIVTGSVHAVDIPFSVSIQLLTPVKVTQMSNGLVFPNTPSESDAKATVAPQDSGAATFKICGRADEEIRAVIVGNNVGMRNGTSIIPVSSFEVDSPMKFDSAGNATVRVGATAMVNTFGVADNRSDFATIRIVHQ